MTDNTGYFRLSKNKKIKLLTPRYVYAKLIFIYSLLYTVSFICGCLLFHSLNLTGSNSWSANILSYFSVDFSKCTDIFDFAGLIIMISRSDLGHLVLVFSAGFTMLSGLIVCSTLLYKGFSLGFSLSYLVFALQEKHITLAHPIASVVIFSIISAVIASILIDFSVKSVLFCDDFKALCGNARKIIRSKAVYSHILRFLIVFGTILILNIIRSIL